jgi:hypothetical protein
MQLVDAVQEIAMQETSTSWLSEEYAAILRDQEAIRLINDMWMNRMQTNLSRLIL